MVISPMAVSRCLEFAFLSIIIFSMLLLLLILLLIIVLIKLCPTFIKGMGDTHVPQSFFSIRLFDWLVSTRSLLHILYIKSVLYSKRLIIGRYRKKNNFLLHHVHISRASIHSHQIYRSSMSALRIIS